MQTIEKIEERAKITKDLLSFPPINDRLQSSTRAHYLWVIAHLNNRIKSGGDINLAKSYLDQIGQNSSIYASKFRGALLGLAIGDALGTTLEFSKRDSQPTLTKMIGGGPFNLKPGEWTDDTSMALCLAHSLTRCEYSNNCDQLDLYCLWWKQGVFSTNGKCFDIGNTVVNALDHYMNTGEGYSGSTDPNSAGNGSIMRLAPMALFYFSDADLCEKWCGDSSKTTHGAKEAVDACRYLGILLHGAIKGEPKDKLTQGVYEPSDGFWQNKDLSPSILQAVKSAHLKSRNQIKSTGYVVDTLEAAIWAFHNSQTFEQGVLLAANLGGDADTVAAVYGQLAGAFYGELQISPEWIKELAHFHVFYHYADKLLRFGMCDTPRLALAP